MITITTLIGDCRVKLVGLNSQVQNALGAHLKVRFGVALRFTIDYA